MNKTELLSRELSFIKDRQIREFTEKAVEMLPNYFFEVAASSTGKYHPQYALGSGGLLRHTKAAVDIAETLLGLEMYQRYTPVERDLIISALILHDGLKHGKTESRYTVAEHPVICADWLRNHPSLQGIISDEQIITICEAISSHMGQWNTDFRSGREILPKPKTPLQKFVHQADYLASRKWLEVNFDSIE